MRRLLIVACAMALTVPAGGAAGRAVSFPRDHYGHARAAIEWWYFTALARDPAGRRYTVFFTLFSSQGGLIPVSQVVDLETGAVLGHTEELAVGKVGGSALDVRAGHTRLRYLRASNTWRFSVSTPGFAVSLTQRPQKPYALHGGGTGLIQQSYGGPSHYYSATSMSATGTLTVGGRTLRLTGRSWFDHQWGDYRDDPRAFNWDWFSCRFDDGTELMLYQFRDAVTGAPLAAFRSGTAVARNGKATGVRDFSAVPGVRTLDAEGRSWPLDWTLAIPSLGLSESLAAIIPDQLVRNTIVPTFWEGATTATGTRAGTCFVELSYR